MIGEVAFVVSPSKNAKIGNARFSNPISGIDEWPFKSDEEISYGDRVKVMSMNNGVLTVEKT